MVKYNKIFEDINQQILKSNYKGFDPYDLQNSKLPLYFLGHKLLFYLTQFNKRSPINFRKLLLIKKSYVTKGCALILGSYLNYYKLTSNDYFKTVIKDLVEILLSLRLTNFHGSCWGLPFKYANRNSVHDINSSDIVTTAFVYKNLHEYYILFKDDEIKDILISVNKYILEDLYRTINDKGICFSYTPQKRDCVFNASGHALEILMLNSKYIKDIDLIEIIDLGINFILNYQKPEGYWNYSIKDDGAEDSQIDFHQGYIIDTLFAYKDFLKNKDTILDSNIKKAITFYYEKQFNGKGFSLWRYPKKYPIDIHNQAQGIITFSKAHLHGFLNYNFADTILKWTIENMYDEKGYFYYQKYRFFQNKINYIRWSQAWMINAISYFLYNENIKQTDFN